MVDVLELPEAGMTREKVLNALPDFEPEDIHGSAATGIPRLDHSVPVA
jgi:uncharacterized protein (DUF433 family)